MPRTRALALAVSSTALALVSSAVAQQTTGTIVGTVVEQDSGNRLAA
jgi:hypothetical protein